jgi:hypothetical protein
MSSERNSGGYLYIADSHLWEVAFKNNMPRSGPFTIFKVKLPHSVIDVIACSSNLIKPCED